MYGVDLDLEIFYLCLGVRQAKGGTVGQGRQGRAGHVKQLLV